MQLLDRPLPPARPVARLRSELDLLPPRERLAYYRAAQTLREAERLQCSGTTGTWTELMYQNMADFSAFNSSASEGSLLAGNNDQPVIPALYFFNKQGRFRAVTLEAEGVMGATSTPTIIFQVRFGTTSGSSFLSGTSVGLTTTITCSAQSVTKYWYLRLKLYCQIAGIGTNNTTLSGAGYVTAPGIFASPFIYPLEPTAPDTATWTSTIDNSVTQYINLSVTWSANSASNSVICKNLTLTGHN